MVENLCFESIFLRSIKIQALGSKKFELLIKIQKFSQSDVIVRKIPANIFRDNKIFDTCVKVKFFMHVEFNYRNLLLDTSSNYDIDCGA